MIDSNELYSQSNQARDSFMPGQQPRENMTANHNLAPHFNA